MKTILRNYQGPEDFIKIRDFLKDAYYSFGKPLNWGLERWNWGRFHPCMFEGDSTARKSHIDHFENAVRIWEQAGQIVALLNTEWREANGEFWVQRVPSAAVLLDEILAEAERYMANPADGKLLLDIYDHDTQLLAAAEKRGYQRPEDCGYWSEIDIEAEQIPLLPPGFSIHSMAEAESRLDLRCKAQGLGFNHPDPAEWSTPEEYALVQTAPDYHAEQDLYVLAPDGQYASVCIVWYDDKNRFGVYEPVCTPPDFRRMGLGRAVIQEGLNRLYRLGARKAYVGSGQDFYSAIGFRRNYISRQWTKQLSI
ncbi:MAG: hypothetical protein KKI09_08920 [Spirochaetes bacterium]|nr:hypothetical protein [Spirochaetota bacterium]MBU0955534.1 hypothetical protein [Spirochaetota bacterium]